MNTHTFPNSALRSMARACLLAAISCLFSHMPLSLSAQERFTDYITRPTEGQGRITLQQDPEIERLVNGSKAPRAAQPATRSVRNGDAAAAADTAMSARDSSQYDPRLVGRRARMNGFRIQVYAGGNNRKSKTEAYHAAGLVRSYYDDLPVYTHFLSPRWICRVGDFRTIEEAQEVLARMRQSGQFPEATIVKTKIVVYL